LCLPKALVQVDEEPPNLKRGLPAKRLAADGARVAITYAKDAIAALAAVKAIELGGGKAILPEYLCDFCRFGYLTGWRKGEAFCLLTRSPLRDGAEISTN
jgi:hypothetical protein